jgi:hypothetical protein
LLYSLTNKAGKAQEIEKKLEVTEIAWNVTGLVLAAAYARLEH